MGNVEFSCEYEGVGSAQVTGRRDNYGENRHTRAHRPGMFDLRDLIEMLLNLLIFANNFIVR